MANLERLAENVFGGRIVVSLFGENDGIMMERGGAKARVTDVSAAQDRLTRERRLLVGLDKIITESSKGAIAGGLTVVACGVLRRSPALIASGLGIALAGGLAHTTNNPARIEVQNQIGYRENALGDLAAINIPRK
jgi:hypothetical protein